MRLLDQALNALTGRAARSPRTGGLSPSPGPRPIRRRMPDLGPIDISPVVVLLGLQFLQYVIVYYGRSLAY